jgi:hypothetical protein
MLSWLLIYRIREKSNCVYRHNVVTLLSSTTIIHPIHPGQSSIIPPGGEETRHDILFLDLNMASDWSCNFGQKQATSAELAHSGNLGVRSKIYRRWHNSEPETCMSESEKFE